MTEPTTAYPHPPVDPTHATPSGMTADRIAKLVTELGVGWAKYGITLGRLALEQSARTLHKTSDLLGVIAERVEKVSTPKTEADGEIVAQAEEVKS